MEDIFKSDAFSDKIVLVTGATSGLGEETARQFAAHGAAVMLTGRDSKRGEAVQSEIMQAGGKAELVLADLRSSEACDDVVTRTVDRLGRIDILFNNAGVILTGPVHSFSDEDWHTVIDTSLHAGFYMARAVLRVMKQQGSGSIVNMASDAALQGYKYAAAYGAAKAAIVHMTRVMALETAEHNIRVNVICPGDIDTPMQEQGYAKLGLGREEMLAAIASTIPMKRHGRAEEIARTVMFMASDAARFATGSVYSVDGGAAAGRSFATD